LEELIDVCISNEKPDKEAIEDHGNNNDMQVPEKIMQSVQPG
jgi:hypothetical protein